MNLVPPFSGGAVASLFAPILNLLIYIDLEASQLCLDKEAILKGVFHPPPWL